MGKGLRATPSGPYLPCVMRDIHERRECMRRKPSAGPRKQPAFMPRNADAGARGRTWDYALFARLERRLAAPDYLPFQVVHGVIDL